MATWRRTGRETVPDAPRRRLHRDSHRLPSIFVAASDRALRGLR